MKNNTQDIISVTGTTNNPNDPRDFQNTRILNITLRLSNNCNFTCKYCGYYDNKIKPINKNQLESFIGKFILEIKDSQNYDKINWYIHGGEPTIYPGFIDMMIFIGNIHKYLTFDYEIEVQTNSSYKKLEDFKKFVDTNTKISFICSFQNHQNTIDQYRNFVRSMFKYNMMAGADIILENFGTEKEFENIEHIIQWLKDRKVEYRHLNPYFNIQTNTVDGISLDKINPKYKKIATNKEFSELVEITYKNGSKEVVDYDTFTSEGRNKFKLFKCNVGQNNLIIDVSDHKEVKVYKCFSDILYQKNKPDVRFQTEDLSLNSNLTDNQPIYGHLEKIIKLLKPTLCIHPKCICEIQIPKKKSYARTKLKI